MSNVPKLRFSEFEGDWQTKRLNALVTSIDSGWSPDCDSRPATLNEWGVLKTTSTTWSGYDEKENKKLPDSLVARPNIEVQENDILITRAGPVNRVGVVAFVSSTRPMLMLSDKLIRIRSSEEVHPPFLSRSISGVGVQKYLAARKSGLAEAQANISQDILRKAPVKVPPTKLEQQKIAAFLTAVDTKIEQLTKKVQLLQQYKKGVMQKIFSQEIRFKADDGSEFPEWSVRRLSELTIKKASTLVASSIEDNTGTFPVYGATGFIKLIDFYTEEDPYISIVKDGAGVGRVLLCEQKSTVLGTLDIIKNAPEMDLYFILMLLQLIDFTKYVTGSTIPHIYYKDYSSEKVNVPTLAEQNKIAHFLGAIDSKLAQVSSQLDIAKTFKKGLLQQMFV